MQEEVILTDNSIYTSQKTQDGLFCIYKDNSRFIILKFKLYDSTDEIFTLTIWRSIEFSLLAKHICYRLPVRVFPKLVVIDSILIYVKNLVHLCETLGEKPIGSHLYQLSREIN